ncbi:uncharacterized protein DS421_20g701140 [Arachis hypogaea]|nr:uncharacterized protein DS421_20g701140 [Arachis hypogaea]
MIPEAELFSIPLSLRRGTLSHSVEWPVSSCPYAFPSLHRCLRCGSPALSRRLCLCLACTGSSRLDPCYCASFIAVTDASSVCHG